MVVSTGFSDLLEKAGRDVQVVALLPSTPESFLSFYKAQLGLYTRYDTQNDTLVDQPLPFYNLVGVYNLKGELILKVEEGNIVKGPLKLDTCILANLCDRGLIEKAITLPIGEIFYGKNLRYYSAKGEPEDDSHAGISVAYRTKDRIYVLRIEYKHLRDHLTTPSFPYEPRRNLVDSYEKGNYIYIVDSDFDMLTHPLPWHTAGIDKKTGLWVTPMKNDSDAGKHPINIAAYQEGVLKNYFTRLLKVSFSKRGVDLFRAPNLAGKSRILSVAPIMVSKGQYKDNELFGHVLIGCNVDYFEEPKEMIVPYY
jgi:hypothetical protein